MFDSVNPFSYKSIPTGISTIPTMIIAKGVSSFLRNLSRRIVIAIKSEKIISPSLIIAELIAVVSFKPKKYVINADTSAIPINTKKNIFRLPIDRTGTEFFVNGVKNNALIK